MWKFEFLEVMILNYINVLPLFVGAILQGDSKAPYRGESKIEATCAYTCMSVRSMALYDLLNPVAHPTSARYSSGKTT